MAVCSVQDLFNQATLECYSQVMSGFGDVLELQILCNLKTYLEGGGDVATCNVASLLADAECFAALTAGQRQWAKLQLLCDISTLLGASGACTVFAKRHAADFADPNGNVTGCPGDVYVRTSTGVLWKKLSGENTNTGWSL